MTELELIARIIPTLATNSSVVAGAGDDCALLDLGLPDRCLLLKTDAAVAGVHFDNDAPPEKIGRKALARNLSDIAAMAGTPLAAVVTIGLPKDFSPEFIEGVYRGLNSLAQQHRIAVVGGETTLSPSGFWISVAVLGSVPKNKCPLRSGAKPGDAIFVTGDLGGSRAGQHLDFEPRLEEARWLAENFPIHSMIDLSDGLASDLRHILKASKAGAELLTSAVPIARAARLAAKRGNAAKPPLLAALTDGEDFELLFTLPGKQAVPLLDAWKKKFDRVRLSCIGKITAARGLKLRDKHGVKEFTGHGYVHFDEP